MTFSVGYFQLVITFAVEAEVPVDWLRDCGVCVVSLKALTAGILNTFSGQRIGILVVITGVGPDRSRAAAEWIRAHIRPLYVVNMGLCGACGGCIQIGTLVAFRQVRTCDQTPILMDNRVPFIGEGDQLALVDELVTCERPLVDSDVSDLIYVTRCVDMEAYAQAAVLEGSGISFHIVKMVSDRADQVSADDYFRALGDFRDEVQRLLAFVERPITASDISVVIPVYNREATIGRCLDSVMGQTVMPGEVIVADDGSDDHTAAIVDVYAPVVKRVMISQNRGVSCARNLGVLVSCGKWLAFLDSDDCWQPDYLAQQLLFINRYPFYQIFQSDEMWIRNGVRVNACAHHRKRQGYIFLDALHLCLISPSAVMIRRVLLDQFRGFDEMLPVCEDYDLWLKITRWYPVGLQPLMSVVKYGGHADQLSRQYEAMDQFRVAALLRMLGEESVDAYRKAMMDVVRTKLQILIQGARKRGLVDKATEYEAQLLALFY